MDLAAMTAFFAAVFILIILAVVILYLNYKLLSMLRQNHPQKWRELGSPSLIINNSIQNNVAVLRFLKNKEYVSIGDKRVTTISRLLWRLGLIYLGLLVVVLISFLISLPNQKAQGF
jgi:uncharacterized membrane protein YidH (DUF202 family)